MKKCVVIGGGFAGLTASAYLANAGFIVELIESSPKLGGRAYSLIHDETNTLVDNGQHIMMGCYKETLKFIGLIGAADKIEIQNTLAVNFIKQNFQKFQLKASSSLYPFNLLSAVLNYRAISFTERFSIIKFFIMLPFQSNRDLEKMSVEEFLNTQKQNENIKKAFWEILCVGALNTNLKKASAKVFVDILKEIFLKGNAGSKIILPKVGLSEMYCEPTKQFIEKTQSSIALSEKVEEIKIEMGKAAAVKTNKRTISDFNYVICAIPFYAMERIKILEGLNSIHSITRSFNPTYSAILNVHIWLKENPLGNNFYALIDSKLHWVFSHESHLTCVISDADYLMNLSEKEILEIIFLELEKYLKIKNQDVLFHFVIKEKRATFLPSKAILWNRPSTQTEIKNLFLAGDWVDTGLPSTIESAVKSGRMAAELVIEANN